jgi:hypothetical protein
MLERSLVDDLVLAYVEWREESTAVWQVYGWWTGTGSENAARAHAVYRAALDREEAAARVYAKLIEAARQLLKPELNPTSLARGALCR